MTHYSETRKVGAGDTATHTPRLGRPWRKLAIAATLLTISGGAALWAAYLYIDRTPGELMRHAERRLIGHPKLEFVILPVFKRLRPMIERPVTGPLPTLGKGQQPQSVANTPPTSAIQIISSETELQQAIASARPGQVLELAPGTYPMTRSIRIHNGGESGAPIVVTARAPGSVMIESTASEGFHLHAPYWIFENLVIRGICKEHSNCEHAFHIVGKAHHIVIRNNHIEDFNAQIKVNGLNGDWPDDGLVQYNTLTNTGGRITAHPVTPIDIVGASRWQVADNLVSNFVKGDGNRVSYGMFMKGAGSDGRIERNLVICTDSGISQPGTRVGISFGGGGTQPANLCRDRRCITEHSGGTVANNIIAHCNDFGIYINSANQSTVKGNTLVNTYGIDVRFPVSSAIVEANVLNGIIRARDGARIETRGNRRERSKHVFPQAFGQ